MSKIILIFAMIKYIYDFYVKIDINEKDIKK